MNLTREQWNSILKCKDVPALEELPEPDPNDFYCFAGEEELRAVLAEMEKQEQNP